MASPRASKAASVSSAGTNASGSLSFLPRYTPKPEPAYVSAAAAADHVTHNHNHDQFDLRSPTASPTNEGALFSDPALGLLNTFLDSLLYNFLAKARSTSLSQLRPAITEVLKAKLARDALASADEELHGLLDEAETEADQDEDLSTSAFGGQSSWSNDWHLEMAFKRMRLRVMVFIRLGDFDDEDEDRFLEEEDEFRLNGEPPSQDMNVSASPAAVYLASILENIAEQALTIAGDAAYRRSSGRTHRRTISEDKELEHADPERVVVEESDVEKITFNPTLGRLWRTWRKNYRAMYGGSGASSPIAPGSPFRGRLGSLNELALPPNRGNEDPREIPEHERHLTPDEIPEGDVSEHDIAANIPLPMADNDVEEIEVPGLAKEIIDEEDTDVYIAANVPLPIVDNDVDEIEVPGLAREITDDEEEEDRAATPTPESPKRPRSAMFALLPLHASPEQARPPIKRLRSNSTPAPGRIPFLAWFMRPATAKETETGPVTEEVEAAVDDEPTAEKLEESVAAVSDKVSPDGEQGKELVEDQEKPSAETSEEHDPFKAGEEEKEHTGVVAGAVAGAAAFVGAAIAAVAGSSHKSDEDSHIQKNTASAQELPESTKSEKSVGKTEELVVKPSQIAPDKSTGEIDNAVRGPVTTFIAPQAVSETKIPGATARKPESVPEAPLEVPELTPSNSVKTASPVPGDFPSTPIEEKGVDEPKQAPASAIFNEKEVVPQEQVVSQPAPEAVPSTQYKPGYEASEASTATSSPADAVPKPSQVAGQAQPVEEKQVVTPEEALAGESEELDDEAIGVARTTNERVHSPSPTPEQQRSYYLPGSPKIGNQTRNVEPPRRTSSFDRNANTNKDRSLVGADEFILARKTSASKRNTGPSPLREVTKAGEQSQQNAEARDTPHAVPFYHRPVDDEALKQEQAIKRATKDTTKPETVKSRPPPLKTTFAEPPAEAVRPTSSAYSAGGRSTSTTPTAARGSSSSGMPRSSDKRPSDDSRQKDFDSLLKESETVKYTLTPDGLRESDPYRPTSSTNRTTTLTTGIDRGPPSPRIVSSSSSAVRSPVADFASSPPPPLATSPKKTGVVPRVSQYRRTFAPSSLTSRPEPMNTNTRKSGFLPREPRVITDDTRDFADFMRSTRPSSEQSPTPLVRSASVSKLMEKANAQAGSSTNAEPSQPRPTSRMRLVPREPDIKGGGSSELIDFIRQGPPGAHTNGEHRIPRTVAPFRSTMDSDELANLGDFGSSIHSSLNQRQSAAATTTSGSSLTQNGSQTQRAGQSSLSAPQPQIVRKTRRVKDPYAIDSDDDDDFLTSLPSGKAKKPQEETMAEFLRNNEPPRSNAPAVLTNGTSSRSKMNGSGATASGTHVNGTRSHSRSNTVGSQGAGATANSSSSVRPPSVAASVSSVPSIKPRRRWEARAAGATRNGFGGDGFHYSTNDMADFLRSSGPVDPGAPSPDVPLSKKPSKRGKKFWQRKSYLDMP